LVLHLEKKNISTIQTLCVEEKIYCLALDRRTTVVEQPIEKLFLYYNAKQDIYQPCSSGLKTT